MKIAPFYCYLVSKLYNFYLISSIVIGSSLSININGFGQTHRTHTSYAPEEGVSNDLVILYSLTFKCRSGDSKALISHDGFLSYPAELIQHNLDLAD